MVQFFAKEIPFHHGRIGHLLVVPVGRDDPRRLGGVGVCAQLTQIDLGGGGC